MYTIVKNIWCSHLVGHLDLDFDSLQWGGCNLMHSDFYWCTHKLFNSHWLCWSKIWRAVAVGINSNIIMKVKWFSIQRKNWYRSSCNFIVPYCINFNAWILSTQHNYILLYCSMSNCVHKTTCDPLSSDKYSWTCLN